MVSWQTGLYLLKFLRSQTRQDHYTRVTAYDCVEPIKIVRPTIDGADHGYL